MDSRLATKRRSPGALPFLLSNLSRVRPRQPAAGLLPIKDCYECIHQPESSSLFYAAPQDTPAPLELQKRGFSCEQVGLKRIYGKPTSPDKACRARLWRELCLPQTPDFVGSR